jgi:XrtJ-associated TM-motif-TM protein
MVRQTRQKQVAMTKNCLRYACLGGLLLAAAAVPVYAQSGCVTSPENPTAVLGLIGAAGLLYSPIKNKLASVLRKRQDQ